VRACGVHNRSNLTLDDAQCVYNLASFFFCPSMREHRHGQAEEPARGTGRTLTMGETFSRMICIHERCCVSHVLSPLNLPKRDVESRTWLSFRTSLVTLPVKSRTTAALSDACPASSSM
jgi:hypothetical protein